ncbi:MAG: ribonuclease M5 [Bacillota bacterium]
MSEESPIIVVEGNHDKARIKQVFPNADVMITNGREISVETLEALKHANEQRGLLLFLDPDSPGEMIRKRINEYVGETRHAFLDKKLCIDHQKGKVGIEHAPLDAIRDALKNQSYEPTETSTDVTHNDLLKYGLVGKKDAKRKREALCNHFSIGLANGKTLLKKLDMFGISKKDIEKVIK